MVLHHIPECDQSETRSDRSSDLHDASGMPWRFSVEANQTEPAPTRTIGDHRSDRY